MDILIMFLSLRGKHSVFHIKYDIICRLPVGFYKCCLSSLYQVEKTVLVLVCWECLLWKSIGFCQIGIIIWFFSLLFWYGGLQLSDFQVLNWSWLLQIISSWLCWIIFLIHYCIQFAIILFRILPSKYHEIKKYISWNVPISCFLFLFCIFLAFVSG